MGEEEDDLLVDVFGGLMMDVAVVEIVMVDNIREAVADGGVDDDVYSGFFFDFAESGFGLGFAGFDVAFREAREAVLLVDDEDFAVMNDDGAARGFRLSVGWSGGDGLRRSKVRVIGGGVIHEDIIA